MVSHEDLAFAIASAEEDIAMYVGFSPAPRWFVAESHPYPRYWKYFGNKQGVYTRVSMTADYGKFVSPGRRAVEYVATARTSDGTLQYIDENGDGYAEVAKIEITELGIADPCQLKLYYSGNNGGQEWEIRPVPSRQYDPVTGHLVMKLETWLMIRLELLCAYPTDERMQAIDVSDVANLLDEIEIYREYTDDTLASALFISSDYSACSICGGVGCSSCARLTQGGCITAKDDNLSIVEPVQATYDSENGRWVEQTWTAGVIPNQVKFWYYAGDRDSRFVNGSNCDPLSDWWAQTIAWMATARLDRPVCTCDTVEATVDRLRANLIENRRGDVMYYSTRDIETCPFGTRLGEVMAYKRLKRLVKKKFGYGVI
jgi:hypothetical protein